jgi:hypothetical protein
MRTVGVVGQSPRGKPNLRFWRCQKEIAAKPFDQVSAFVTRKAAAGTG